MYYKDEYDALKHFVECDYIDDFTRKRANNLIKMIELLDEIHFIDAGALILAAIDTVYAPAESDFIAEMFGNYNEWKPFISEAHNEHPLDNLFGDVGADLDELFGGDDE